MAFIYVNKTKDEQQKDEGPFVIRRLYDDGHYESTDEPEFEHNPDAFARASFLNRGIGYNEKQARAFGMEVHEARRERRREEEHKRQQEQRRAEEAERRRKHEEEIAAGSPGSLSVVEVATLENWERVADLDGSTWPASRQCVVRHQKTGVLWSCRYTIREDDSDADQPQHWERVEAKQVTVTKYEPVSR